MPLSPEEIRAARARSGRPPAGGLIPAPAAVRGPLSQDEIQAARRRSSQANRGVATLPERVGQFAGEGAQALGRGVEGTLAAARDPDVQRMAAEIAGSMVAGGLAGGAVGAGAGGARAVATRAGAAGLGSLAASEGVTQLQGRDETLEDARNRRARSFFEGAGGEALGELGRPVGSFLGQTMFRLARRVPVLRRFFDPSRAASMGRIREGAEEALDALTRKGAPPTLGQLVDSNFVDTMENAAEASFLGGNRILDARRDAAQAAIKMVDDFVGDYAQRASQQEAGVALDAAMTESGMVFRAVTRNAWQQVDAAANAQGLTNLSVDLLPMKDELRKRFGSRASIDKTLRGVLDWVDSFPDKVTFAKADDIRSILLEMGRAGGETIFPGTVKGATKRAGGLIDEAIEQTGQAFRETGGDAFDLWRSAKELTRFGKETFNDKLMGQLLHKVTPETAWRLFARDASPSLVRRVREIVRDPHVVDPETGQRAIENPTEFWNGLKGQWLLEKMASSVPKVGGEFDAASVMARIRKSGETFTELFDDPKEQQQIMKLLRTVQIAQGRAGGTRSGSMVVQLAQGAALFKVASGLEGFDNLTVAVLVGPVALAMLLRNPTFARFMLRGATGQFTGEQGARFMGQLAARMREEEIPFRLRVPDGQGGFDTAEIAPGQAPKLIVPPTPQQTLNQSDFARREREISRQLDEFRSSRNERSVRTPSQTGVSGP